MQPQKELGRRRLVLTALVLTSLVLITLFLRETSDGALHRVQDAGLGTVPHPIIATRAVQPFKRRGVTCPASGLLTRRIGAVGRS